MVRDTAAIGRREAELCTAGAVVLLRCVDERDMDILNLLSQEDDNPAGRGSKYRGGSTLEEAGEAEARRREIQAMRWSLGRQEAGIINLIQAKNFFQRLKLPEPPLDPHGPPLYSEWKKVASWFPWSIPPWSPLF